MSRRIDNRGAPWHINGAVPSAHSTCYEALPRATQLIAQAYGVAAPRPFTPQQAYAVLRDRHLRVVGRGVTLQHVRQATAELAELGVLGEVVGDGRAAVDGWALTLTMRAFQEGNLKRFWRAIDQLRSRRYDGHPDMLDMSFRCHLVAGEFDVIDDMVEGEADYEAVWGFLAEPLREDLIVMLPERHLAPALAGCIDHAIKTAAPAEPIIDLGLHKSPEPAKFAADIAFVRVMQGRFAAAEGVFQALPPHCRDCKAAATGLASTRALIALLRGDDDGAERHIRDALEHERAGTRKRLAFVETRAFVLSLLALARMDTSASHKMLRQILRGGDRTAGGRAALGRFADELGLIGNAARARSQERVFASALVVPRLTTLFDSLVCCWIENFRPYRQHRENALRRFRARATDAGFDWVVAECDEVLRRLRNADGDSPPAAEAPSGDHGRLGTMTLANLAAPLPEWEFSLRRLERFAHDAKSAATDRAQPRTAAKRRLVWELQGTNHRPELTAREQRQLKNGSWSKGRQVALRRLTAEHGNMDFLRDQDREAIAAVSTYQYWRGDDKLYAGTPSLYALAGHPHVFNARGEIVDVVRRDPELVVDEDSDGNVLARIRPHVGDLVREYDVRMPNSRRCEVTRFTPRHRNLFEAVPVDGLKVPRDAKQRLLEAVSLLAGDIRVQSDSGGAATAIVVPADAEPWVRLEPFEAGLTVALLVEPIPDSDVFLPPGTGGATVFASVRGESAQAERDLAAERAGVERLIVGCPRLVARPTELAPLVLPEPGECLEFLEQLNAVGARCKWPKGEPFRVVARAATRSLGLTIRSAEDWLRTSGGLVIDNDRVLDLKRLFALLEARPGSRFLELEDGKFVALTDAFRRQLDDFASLAAPGAKGEMRLNPLAALALDDLLQEAEVDTDQSWNALRSKLAEAQSFEPRLPGTLQAELRPYQIEGFCWLARLARWGAGACLADDMGLGKTLQTLAVLLDRAPQGPALVVAPTSVLANWVDEARRFAPTLNVKVYADHAATRSDLLADLNPFDLVVTTYGVAQNDVDALAAVRWRSAVLDEAQAIKNPDAKRSRAMWRLAADFRMATTGTPIQNNIADLYSLFRFVNPGLLGSLPHFRRHFQASIERDGDAVAHGRLRRLIAPFVLRRMKADVLDDLPERTEITLHVEMSAQEASLYEALRQRALDELEAARGEDPDMTEGRRRVRVLAHLTRLRLACCDPRLVLDEADDSAVGNLGCGGVASSKLAAFATTLCELLANRHKVLVFSQFVKHLRLVREYLDDAGIDYQYLDGATIRGTRAERIAAFQAGAGDVFLISLKAGGSGLNLTAADYVIHMDPWWNPAAEDQASDRAHRIGQTRPVTIYRLVAKGTIEERIVDLHRKKRELADQLLAGSDAAGRLDADELLALLRRPLAV